MFSAIAATLINTTIVTSAYLKNKLKCIMLPPNTYTWPDGKYHAPDGPAVETPDSAEWYKNAQFHKREGYVHIPHTEIVIRPCDCCCCNNECNGGYEVEY